MILLCGLCSLLFFNPIIASNLQSYNLTPPARMKKEEFQNYKGIFDECFTDSGPVVIIGSLPTVETLKQLFSVITKPFYLLDNKENRTHKTEIKKIAFTPKTYYSKSITATNFIIEITSTLSLKNRLAKLINSPFWNVFGFFLVINIKNCQLIYSHLKIVWEFNILNVVYCCHHPTYGLSFYTFNPFNDEAPKNWEKIATVYQKNKHAMRIFKKLSNKGLKDAANCKDFLFDKIKNLSGYPLKVVSFQDEFEDITDITGKVYRKKLFNLSQSIVRLIWTELGANINYELINVEELGAIDSDGSTSEAMSKIVDGEYECKAVMDFRRGFWRHEVNMYINNGICYTTRKDLIPITEQLIKALPLKLSIISLILFGISTCIYMYSMKMDSSKVALDIFRAILGQSMIYKPQNKLSHVIFSGIIFICMLLTTALQSLLSAIVSAPVTVGKDISSSEDLVAYNLNVYGDHYFYQYYSDTPLRNKISPISTFAQCKEMVLKNGSVACIENCVITGYCAQEDDKLHITTDQVIPRYNVYFFRQDSPFKRKIQIIASFLLQSGITQYMIDNDKNQFKQKRLSRVFTKITVYQLRSAFYILFICVILSFVLFFAELLVYYMIRNIITIKSHKKENRKKLKFAITKENISLLFICVPGPGSYLPHIQ